MMKRLIAVLLVCAVVLVAGSVGPLRAQTEEPPAWAVALQQSLDRIEAQNTAILARLDGGVVLAGQQGAVTFGQVRIVTDKQHDAALYIRNYNADGYGVYARGTSVGLLAEGDNWEGIEAIGNPPVSPDWRKNGR